ncbi:hypothetical protein FQN52_003714 [Onygenales sp. PD_12]|nr:hypothetical protein FQN53_003192 [Emmonsiellopsis sp. PD_33]KAK2792237.1 hypothetical protein FQN52_003714 [Onygenales sp. PD_12]
MHTKTIIAAATALATLLPTALAGTAKIKNQCKDTVHIWSIADTGKVEKQEIKPGGEYSEEYRNNPNGGGISIKMALTEDDSNVSQFEYTLSEPKVFYDLSNIDGYPFSKYGITLTPSDDECPKVKCDPGVELCNEAYNQPYDDHATHGCPSDSDLTMVLCSGGSKKRAVHPRDFRV